MSAAETVEEPTVVAAANPEPVQDVVMEKPEKEPEPKTEDDSNLPLKDINEMEKVRHYNLKSKLIQSCNVILVHR